MNNHKNNHRFHKSQVSDSMAVYKHKKKLHSVDMELIVETSDDKKVSVEWLIEFRDTDMIQIKTTKEAENFYTNYREYPHFSDKDHKFITDHYDLFMRLLISKSNNHNKINQNENKQNEKEAV